MAEVKAPALSPQLVKPAEFIRNVWAITIPPKIPLGSILAPEFWAHCAKSFKQYDKIECRAQDNAWYAELIVRKVEAQAVHAWVVNYTDLEAQAAHPAQAGEASDYTIGFAPRHGWRVVRNSDKEVVHKGSANQADAEKWLADHLKTTV